MGALSTLCPLFLLFSLPLFSSPPFTVRSSHDSGRLSASCYDFHLDRAPQPAVSDYWQDIVKKSLGCIGVILGVAPKFSNSSCTQRQSQHNGNSTRLLANVYIAKRKKHGGTICGAKQFLTWCLSTSPSSSRIQTGTDPAPVVIQLIARVGPFDTNEVIASQRHLYQCLVMASDAAGRAWRKSLCLLSGRSMLERRLYLEQRH
jgi:hypothetical protein